MMLLALLPWFCLMAAGLVASVVLLFWGHGSGQFSDQERARYLPLRGEDMTEPGRAGSAGREVYVLVGFIAATGIALAVCLAVAVFMQGG